MYLQSGTLLQGGKYKIVRFIKSGGFGCTYEARHTVFDERVAIKEFFPKDFCNRESDKFRVTVGTENKKALVSKLKRKFIDEAVALRKLPHPGIVSVSDVFEENGTAYYVMDYIDGCSLDDLVRRDGALSEHKSLSYIREVCSALAYVHSRNRLHLDIKPGNIMVDNEGHVILIDFGTSKQYDEENGENTSTLLGLTPGYAPAEQYRREGVSHFTETTDIYSLGATLYMLLSGVKPIDAIARASGESLQSLPVSLASQIRNAVYSSMDMDKTKRPQSVKEFLAMMDEGTVVTPPPPPPPPKKSFLKWIIGLSAVCVTLVTLYIVFRDVLFPPDMNQSIEVTNELISQGRLIVHHPSPVKCFITDEDPANMEIDWDEVDLTLDSGTVIYPKSNSYICLHTEDDEIIYDTSLYFNFYDFVEYSIKNNNEDILQDMFKSLEESDGASYILNDTVTDNLTKYNTGVFFKCINDGYEITQIEFSTKPDIISSNYPKIKLIRCSKNY